MTNDDYYEPEDDRECTVCSTPFSSDADHLSGYVNEERTYVCPECCDELSGLFELARRLLRKTQQLRERQA